MDWKKILSLPINIYDAIKEDSENSILLAVAIGIVVVCNTLVELFPGDNIYYIIGFAVTAAGLVIKTVWEMFKTKEIKKGIGTLIQQQVDLLGKLDEAQEEVEELRNKLRNRRNKNKNNNANK